MLKQKERITVSLNAGVLAKLKDRAAQEERSVAGQLNYLLKNYFEFLEELETWRSTDSDLIDFIESTPLAEQEHTQRMKRMKRLLKDNENRM